MNSSFDFSYLIVNLDLVGFIVIEIVSVAF